MTSIFVGKPAPSIQTRIYKNYVENQFYVEAVNGNITIELKHTSDGDEVDGYWDISLEYSKDLENWIEWQGTSINALSGEKVAIRAKNDNETFSTFDWDTGDSHIYKFKITGEGNASFGGSVQWLLSHDGSRLDAPENCFEFLFEDCIKMIKAPNLTARTLSENCYQCMFSGCENLVEPPVMMNQNLAEWCCASMFEYCSSLEKAPKLNVLELADGCYNGMFKECTSLKSVELPARQLVHYCYANMFEGCFGLLDVYVDFTEWNDNGQSTYQWMKDVRQSPNSVFFCKALELEQLRGMDHIPNSWTIQNKWW